MAVLLAKVRLGDNRQVDEVTVVYWHELIGDLDLEPALAALRKFRRERPGVYLEPGHLLELAGVDESDPWSHLPDSTAEVIAESKAKQLAAAGVTEAEYEQHKGDRAWLAAKFGTAAIEGGRQ